MSAARTALRFRRKPAGTSHAGRLEAGGPRVPPPSPAESPSACAPRTALGVSPAGTYCSGRRRERASKLHPKKDFPGSKVTFAGVRHTGRRERWGGRGHKRASPGRADGSVPRCHMIPFPLGRVRDGPWRPLRLGLAGDGLSDRGLRNAKPSQVTPGARAQGAGLGHRWCLRTSLQASVPSKQQVPRGLHFGAFCFNSSFLRLISS